MMTNILRLLFISCMSLILFSCEDENLDDFSDPREQFLGTWDVSENELKDAYSVEIVKNPSNSTQVLIKNFYNYVTENSPAALVVGKKIYFNNAIFFDSETEVNGEGFLDKDKITWHYKVFDGADEKEYDAIYTRQ